MTINQLKELAKHAMSRTAPSEFSVDSVDRALSDGFKELAGSINDFLKNQYDIFNIIIENADEYVPKKLIDIMGRFAEIQVVGQNVKPLFKKRVGKNRARKFITQVGLSGVYETFRLDADTFTVDTHAVGGAITMDFERFLDGAENLPELMEVLTEGLTDAAFIEVQKALKAAFNAVDRPARNKVISNGFSAQDMFNLIATVKNYGEDAVIFACPEFVGAMGPDAIVSAASSGNPVMGVYAPSDIEAIHNTGYVSMFRGTPIVQIPQSFVDETNTKYWIDPQYAYVLPTGKEKVVKLVIEGATQMWSATNRDQSIEVNAYKKLGVAVLANNYWGIYRNRALGNPSASDPYEAQDVENPYGY